MRYLIALIMGLLLGVLSGDASACHRCGIFGRKCRFANSHHVAHVPAAVNNSQNFIFNNLYPGGFPAYGLLDFGQSVYGVQAASGAYLNSAALQLDRSTRLAEQINENQAVALQLVREEGANSVALVDALSKREANLGIMQLAAQAIASNDGGPAVQQLSVSIGGDGRMTVGGIGANGQPFNASSFQGGACSRCHDGQGTGGAPKSLDLRPVARISEAQYQKCLTRILDGTMPPKTPLGPDQQRSVITALARLVNHESPPAVGNPPEAQPPGGY